MTDRELAEKILSDVGGKENVNDLTHCITRLRFKLKDENVADTKEIKATEGVATVIQQAGQYQVVIGPKVGDIYDQVVQLMENEKTTSSLEKVSNEKSEKESLLDKLPEGKVPLKKEGIFSKLIDVISGVFTPLLGLLVANGFMKGFLILLVAGGIAPLDSGTYQVFKIVSDCFFYFFPVFLGYTAMKKFGGTPFIGMALGCALVYPELLTIMQGKPLYLLFEGTAFQSPVYLTFFGIPVLLVNYATSVLPIIFSTYVAAKFEKFLNQHIKPALKTLLVPFLIFLVIIPLTFIVIGPITNWISLGLGVGAKALFDLNSTLFGALYGGLIQICVIFGVHWGFVALSLNNMSTLGYDPITVMGATSAFAQAGAVLGLLLKSKSKNLKVTGIPSILSAALFGVTEPAIYGINLPRKKPFIFASIGGAIGGAIWGYAKVATYSYGAGGIFQFLTIVNPKVGIDSSFYFAIVGAVVSFVVSFALVALFWKEEEELYVEEKQEKVEKQLA